MWNYLYRLWRSVLRGGERGEDAAGGADASPRAALRDELRRLLEERSILQNTAASYLEFGYEDLAAKVRDQVAAADRRIASIRLQLRRREPARQG